MQRNTTRRKHVSYLASITCLTCLLSAIPAFPQAGVATGGTAVRARPLPAGLTPPVVNYEDIAPQAGLTGKNVSGGQLHSEFIIETTGTGVAIFDYDNDGLPDILLVNADRLKNEGAPNTQATTHFLYHNLGNLKFEDVTAKAGITHSDWGQGVCTGDVDNDGNTDVFITAWGHNTLFHNQGNGTFQDQTKDRGLAIDKPRWSSGCAFLDFNRDGFQDLMVAHYVNFDLATTPRPGDKSQCMWKGKPVMCGPRGLPGETISLYQNDGKGHFTDVSDKMHITGPRDYYCFSPLTGDFDNDGWPDVYIACDSTASLYYHNNGGKSFEEMGVVAGVAYNEDGREQAGMGVTAADFNGSGMLDIFKTNFADDTPTYYRNLGKNNFEDATIATGLAVNTKFLGWGTTTIDADDDGWKDILVVNGHVYPEVDNAKTQEKFKQSRLLYWNRRDRQFYDLSSAAGPGIAGEHSSRGLAVGDLNNDGSQEAVVVNLNEAPSLLRNTAPRLGNSILIRALNPWGSDSVGARVTVTTGDHKQLDEVRSGGSYISQNDMRLHFGLGKAAVVDIAVTWPSGKTEIFPAVAANQIITIQQAKTTEGKGTVSKQPYTQSKAQ